MTDQSAPHTVASLSADLRTLGLAAGDVVILHASARSVGFVIGGPQAIAQAVLDVLGPEGTLVVPTHTPENTDPAGWQNPPVPESWWPAIRGQAPGFDPVRTPASRWMGIVAETVRNWPGAVRSDHPQVSFAAVGRQAREVTGRPSTRRRVGRQLAAGRHLPARRQGVVTGRRSRLQHLAAPGRVAPARTPAPPHRLFHPATGRLRHLDHVDRRRRGRERLRDDRRRLRDRCPGKQRRPGRQRHRPVDARSRLVDFATQWIAVGRRPASGDRAELTGQSPPS